MIPGVLLLDQPASFSTSQSQLQQIVLSKLSQQLSA